MVRYRQTLFEDGQLDGEIYLDTITYPPFSRASSQILEHRTGATKITSSHERELAWMANTNEGNSKVNSQCTGGMRRLGRYQ